MPISKALVRLVSSLEKRRQRQALRLFVAEGDKLVCDLSSGYRVHTLVATQEFVSLHGGSIRAAEVVLASREDLQRLSFLKAPQNALALMALPEWSLSPGDLLGGFSLALDRVQDPGNLGTIIRVADWFGIRNIVCSPDSVDAFNPKTVQATMGALARVRVHYLPLVPLLASLPPSLPVCGTFLNGEDIYKMASLPREAVIVMGNEGQGISPEVEGLVSSRLLVPSFPQGAQTSESLNVAVATAVVCAEFCRRLRS